MLDYLKCEYPLPIPKELEKDKNFSISGQEFQTFSFDHPCMDEYEISDDGQVYRWSIERVVETENGRLEIKEKSRELLKLDHTGEVLFSTLYMTDNKDYYIDYKVLFWKGDLKEVSLEDVDVSSNKKRIQGQQQLKSYISKLNDRRSRWWFIFYEIIRSLVRSMNFCIRWVLGWIIKLTWKIDNWIIH